MKTALITGSAKRIGKEIALHFSALNYRVVIHYNSSSEEAEELSKSIPNSKVVFGNFKHSDAARFILDQVDGEVDVFINNAAHFANDTLESFTFDSFYRHMMINLYGPVSIVHELAKRYKSTNIINILDSWAYDNPKNFLSYCLSKNSLRSFTKQVAHQLPEGFRVNGISIGATMHKDGFSKDFFDNLNKEYPSSVEDICKAIDNILSDGGMNGEIIDLAK